MYMSDGLIRKAQLLEVTLEREPEEEYGWYTYLYTPTVGGRMTAHLHRMILNWRISEIDGPHSYGRHWCYTGIGEDTFLRALEALKAWDCDPDSEPEGWIKKG